MAHTLRTTTRDGKMFYIIGSHPISDEHIVICNTIAERNAIAAELDGFVLVKTAFRDDPTVHRGWAMYIKEMAGSEINWIKVAEQESVEGIWGINEELLKQFVTWNNFTSHINQQNRKNKKYDDYQTVIDYVKKLVHEHKHLKVLEGLNDNHGALTYNDKIVGGTYVYDAVVEVDDHDHEGEKIKKLQWADPTIEGATPEDVTSSTEIAERFAYTSLSFAGQILMVTEVDGSISCFFIHANGTELVAKFIGSYGGELNDSKHNVQFVDALPGASVQYYGKGYYYLLPPGRCGNVVGHFYECMIDDDTYYWEDVNERNSKLTDVSGAKITTCFRKDWNTISVTWSDPKSITRLEDDNRVVKWSKSYLVRKFGSAPVDKDDGLVVKVSFSRNEFRDDPFVDVCPISSEKVFYAVFSESAGGEIYDNDDEYSSEAVFPDWSYIRRVFNNQHLKKMFKVGDIIVSPFNPVIGRSIDFEIVEISTTKMKLVAKHKIGSLPFDCREWGMTPTTDTSWIDDKKYFRASRDGDAVEYDEYDGEHYDTPVNLGLFENPSNDHYDQTEKIEHGSNVWLQSNLYRWLNSDSEHWFEAQTPFDRRDDAIPDENPSVDIEAYSEKGFLFGFKEYEDFFALISSVTLPTEDTHVLAAIEDKTGSIWAEGSDTPTRFFANVFYNGSLATQLSHPEDMCDVYPVLELVQA